MKREMISILMLIRQWQSSQGLANHNFNQYRRFTKNRSKKIRKTLGLSFGRKYDTKKFYSQVVEQKNLSELEDYVFEKFLSNLMLCLERYYSYYSEYKSNVSNIKKQIVQKKLLKGVKILEKFLQSNKQFLSEKLQLEFAVYQSQFASCYAILKQDFQTAKIQSGLIIKIISDLLKQASLFEKSYLQQIIMQAEQINRLSLFQLQDYQLTSNINLDQFEQPEIQGLMKQLESRRQKTQEVSVSIFGTLHNIDDANLISYINKLDLLRKNLGE